MTFLPHPIRSALIASCATLLVAGTAHAQYGPKGGSKPTPPSTKDAGSAGGAGKSTTAKGEARLRDKLDPADLKALKANLDYMVPAPTDDLVWLGGDALTRDSFRGQVTVIQSVGGKGSPRSTLERIKKALPDGVRLVGLHTPDGADRADDALKTNPPCLVAIDASGDWCDALGVWKRPATIVVGKSGAVEYVDLNEAGLKAKLPELMAVEVDDSISATERPSEEAQAPAAADAPAEWPTFLSPVQSAADMRGKAIPGFKVQKWLTPQPNPGNRLIAIDFWATWCNPCRASIPHLNEMHAKRGQDVLVVGISDEAESAFNAGAKKHGLQPSQFSYSLAIDPAGTLKDKFFAVKGIPHMAIISPDGVVRWQGHPMSLSEQDLDKLVAANKALSKPAAEASTRGWAATRKAKDQKAR